MGQTDLASNSLTSHPDVFADIINTIIYKGRTVLEAANLKPFYVNSTITKSGRLRGLYRDNCMEDLRGGIRYVIWGLENQYVPDRTTLERNGTSGPPCPAAGRCHSRKPR